jgi:hypothetical protein
MARFMTILASVVLTAALTPLAANAMTATPLNPMQIQVHKAISSSLPNVQLVAAHSDAAATGGQTGQTIVRSGLDHQKYPESVGG